MRIDNPSISGSLSFIQGTNTISGTSVSLTGSLSGTFQGQFSGDSLSNISGAFDSVSSSLASERLKNTTDTLDGDLTVTGKITAQEFHTEFVSASIIYESGSTQFGNSADDTHIFSGSISVSNGITGTLSTAAQSNITSLGTLSSLAVNGNLFAGRTSQITGGTQYGGFGGELFTNQSVGNTAIFSTLAAAGSGVPVSAVRGNDGPLAYWFNSGSAVGLVSTANSATSYYTSPNSGVIGVDANTIGFNTSSGERLRITSTGNVGIGTTSPNAKLHIQNGYLLIDTNTPLGSGIWMPDTNGNPSLRITLDVEAASYSGIINQWGNSSNPGIMVGTNRSDGTAFQVRSGVTVTNGFANNDGSVRFIVGGDGNVGIGTTSPNNTPGYTTLTLNNGTTGSIIDLESNGTLVGRLYNNTSNVHLYNQTANSIVFGTGGVEKARIDSSGNLGVNAVPENSAGVWRNFQLGSLSMSGRSISSVAGSFFGTNFKFTTANAEQRISAHATSRIYFNDDTIIFQNAGADSAGSNIGWSERMRITSGGTITTSGTISSTADINTTAAMSIGSGQISSAFGRRQITRVVANCGGAGIFSTLFTQPQVGYLYAVELNTDKYLIAALFKANAASAVITTVVASNGLFVAATNNGGTILLGGSTVCENIRMKAVVEEC